jgi:hypothetical protein
MTIEYTFTGYEECHKWGNPQSKVSFRQGFSSKNQLVIKLLESFLQL